jgi:hypothetical protein
MSTHILQAAPNRPRLTFLPLFYSLAGWGLAHAWLILIHASLSAHILAAVPALALVALSSLRASADGMEKERGIASPGSGWAAARGALLLLFVGAGFGLLVVNGSVFLLVMAALSFTFVPSAWLPFGTHNVGLPVLITGIGFMSVIVPGFQDIGYMVLPLATWAFWICACCPLLLRIEQSWRAERARKAKGKSAGAEVHAATCDG